MNEPTQALKHDMSTLVEDARALIHATSEAVEEKIVAARNRLTTALDAGRNGLGNIRERTMEGARAAEHVVQVHPYQALGIALGAGALLGMLIAWRR